MELSSTRALGFNEARTTWNHIYYGEYYRGIMFQLPQNGIYIYLRSRNWKTCLLLHALRDAYKSCD